MRNFENLPRRIVVPERPLLAAARAAISDVSDARIAWQSLANREVIPANWRDDASRRFLYCPCPECPVDEHGDIAHLGCRACAASKFSFAYPRNVRACLSIAAWPAGIVRAEELARQAVIALQDWETSVGPLVQWQVESRQRIRSGGFKRPPLGLLRANPTEWLAHAERVDGEHPQQETLDPLGEDISVCLKGEQIYESLAQEGVAPYCARRNPFTPLLDILELGYVPRRYDDEGFVLVVELV